MDTMHPLMAQALAPFAPQQSEVHKIAKRRDPEMTVSHAGIEFRVVYEFTPAERPNYNVDSPTCGPGHPAEVIVLEAHIGDYEVTDVLKESVLAALADCVLEGML